MRGLGTVSNGIYPGYLRRVNSGVIQNAGAAGASLSLWMFATSDTAATVEGANYFNSWVTDLVIGSVIFAAMAIGGTPKFKTYMVTANNGTTVTVSLQTTTAG